MLLTDKHFKRRFVVKIGILLAMCALVFVIGTNLSIASGIEEASTEQINMVKAVLGEKYPVSKIAAIRSGNHANAYYVGAVFSAVGIGNTTGVWIMSGSKNSPGMVNAVDGTASNFSGLPKASKTMMKAYSTDSEVKALWQYLK
jgi:hypothetical protein